MWSKIFRVIPAVVLAEPFEILGGVYGLGLAASILIREERGQASPSLGSLPSFGPAPFGVYAWAITIFIGSALILIGLILAGFNPLDRKPRIFEGNGLLLFAAPIAQDEYLATVHLAHAGPLFIYQAIGVSIGWTLVAAALVRFVSIASPVGILAVSRISRVRLVRKNLIEMSRGDGKQ